MLRLLSAYFIFSVNLQTNLKSDYPPYAGTICINNANFEELLEIPFLEEEDVYLIIKERQRKEFKNEEDFIRRVPLENYKLHSLVPLLSFKQKGQLKGNYSLHYKSGDITGYGRFEYGNIFLKAKFNRNIYFITGNTYIQAGIFETRYSWRSKSLCRYLTGDNFSFYVNFPFIEGSFSESGQIIKFKTPFIKNRVQLALGLEDSKPQFYALQFIDKIGKIHMIAAAEYDSSFKEKFKIWSYTRDVLLGLTILYEPGDMKYSVKFSKMLSKNTYFIYDQQLQYTPKTTLGLKTVVGNNFIVTATTMIGDNAALSTFPLKIEMRNNTLAFTYIQDVEYGGHFSSLCINFGDLSFLFSMSRNYSSMISLRNTGIGYYSEFIGADETLSGIFYSKKIHKIQLAAGLITENFKTYKIQLTLRGEL